jgi:hypothetical protein
VDSWTARIHRQERTTAGGEGGGGGYGQELGVQRCARVARRVQARASNREGQRAQDRALHGARHPRVRDTHVRDVSEATGLLAARKTGGERSFAEETRARSQDAHPPRRSAPLVRSPVPISRGGPQALWLGSSGARLRADARRGRPISQREPRRRVRIVSEGAKLEWKREGERLPMCRSWGRSHRGGRNTKRRTKEHEEEDEG